MSRNACSSSCVILIVVCVRCVQAVELAPGVASGAFWREARVLRQCAHERIVPLYGVAIRVRMGRHAACALLCCFMTMWNQSNVDCSAAAGTAADAGDRVYARRDVEVGLEEHAASAEMACQVDVCAGHALRVLVCGQVTPGSTFSGRVRSTFFLGGLHRCRGWQVAVDVAEAVAYLHSLRVVHSDLKSRCTTAAASVGWYY